LRCKQLFHACLTKKW